MNRPDSIPGGAAGSGNTTFDMPSLYSFDIFDTVVTRRLARPVDVFTILGERLREEGIRVPPFGLFRLLRIRCERWSRRFDPSQEVALLDIHRMMGRFLAWSGPEVVRAAEVEREVEASVLTSTPHGRRAVEDARRAGTRIAYVSDMYLDGNFLRSILRREGLYADGDLLAVSVEWKASKSRGSIWQPLLERLGVSPQEVLHQGDNPQSDVDSARAAGIMAQRLGTSEVSLWEVPPWRQTAENLSLHGGIAAISRMSRAACTDPDNYWTQLGACCIGPMIRGFVAWLVARAKEDGISTLWFLSRDGWLFYQAALICCQDSELDFQYVGINRNQLRFAIEGARPLEELFADSRSISWDLVLERLHFSKLDIKSLQHELGFSRETSVSTLSASEQSVLRDLLRSDRWSRLRELRATEAAQAIQSYLAQCAAGAKKIGLVDVGWQGRSQDILEMLCPAVSRGYYLGLSQHQPSDRKVSWLFDLGRQQGIMQLNNFQRMIETLIGSDSGPLAGYRHDSGVWKPVFASSNSKESTPGRASMHTAALEFVKMSDHIAYRRWWKTEQLLIIASNNLKRLLEKPRSQDLKAFRNWQVTTDDAHQDSVRPALGFDLNRLVRCLKRQEPWGLIWPQAAIRNSSKQLSFMLRIIVFARKLRPR